MIKLRRLIALGVVGTMVPASIFAGQVFIYPAKGQSEQQTQRDKADCSQWATQQTGFDPTAPAPPAPGQSEQQKSASAGKGAGKGAAVGAAVGVITHDHNPWSHDALEGAAKGAVVVGFSLPRGSSEEPVGLSAAPGSRLAQHEEGDSSDHEKDGKPRGQQQLKSATGSR